MKNLFLSFLIFCSSLLLASDGTFSGKVVNGPNLENNQRWVYIQSPKGTVRRVNISKADIIYSHDVSKKKRGPTPENAIQEGSEVRVTATQDGDGEWQASRVEILTAKDKRITKNQ